MVTSPLLDRFDADMTRARQRRDARRAIAHLLERSGFPPEEQRAVLCELAIELGDADRALEAGAPKPRGSDVETLCVTCSHPEWEHADRVDLPGSVRACEHNELGIIHCTCEEFEPARRAG